MDAMCIKKTFYKKENLREQKKHTKRQENSKVLKLLFKGYIRITNSETN